MSLVEWNALPLPFEKSPPMCWEPVVGRNIKTHKNTICKFWFSLAYPWFFFLYPCSQKWILCIPDSINQAHLEVLKRHSSIWEHTVCRRNFIFCRKTSTPLPVALFFPSTLTKLSGSWDPAWRQCRITHFSSSFLFLVGIQYATDQLCLLQESISAAKCV